jgi:hypothetical protein
MPLGNIWARGITNPAEKKTLLHIYSAKGWLYNVRREGLCFWGVMEQSRFCWRENTKQPAFFVTISLRNYQEGGKHD